MGARGLPDAGRMMFDATAFIAEQTEAVRKSVPGKAIIACSGGVDSTAAAVLASRALGDRLLAVYIDTGLMRKGETEDVTQTLKELGVRHRIVHATDEFFGALRGIVDPEKKRAVIGRMFGEVTPDRVALVRGASAIVEEEIQAAAGRGLMALPWQYFAVLLPVQTVGVHGDLRVYGQTVAVRAVDSIDGMTAVYSKIPHEVLDRISIRITNEVGGINRVVYDVSNKPPATVEWE